MAAITGTLITFRIHTACMTVSINLKMTEVCVHAYVPLWGPKSGNPLQRLVSVLGTNNLVLPSLTAYYRAMTSFVFCDIPGFVCASET